MGAKRIAGPRKGVMHVPRFKSRAPQSICILLASSWAQWESSPTQHASWGASGLMGCARAVVAILMVVRLCPVPLHAGGRATSSSPCVRCRWRASRSRASSTPLSRCADMSQAIHTACCLFAWKGGSRSTALGPLFLGELNAREGVVRVPDMGYTIHAVKRHWLLARPHVSHASSRCPEPLAVMNPFATGAAGQGHA